MAILAAMETAKSREVRNVMTSSMFHNTAITTMGTCPRPQSFRGPPTDSGFVFMALV